MNDHSDPISDLKSDLRRDEPSPPISSETEIELLLSRIRPQPGARFYNQLGTKPWNHDGHPSVCSRMYLLRLPAVLTLMILIILFLVSPSMEVVANRIAQFFTPADKDLVLVQIPLLDLKDPETRILHTIPEATSLVGFQVQAPTPIPDGYTFIGAEYKPDRESIILNYDSDSGYLLRISQRLSGVEYQSISINAYIETVKIGVVTGEYVVGGWKATSIHNEDQTSPLTITLEAIWDPEANIHFLRWQENDILYELIFSGDNPDSYDYLNKDDLISIAENMH